MSIGTMLRAQIADVIETHLGPRLYEYDLVLTSRQDGLHLRLCDVLCTLDDAAISIRIDDIERRGPFTWVTGRVGNGKRAAKRLTRGEVLDFGPGAPDWRGAGNALAQMSTRMETTPWTHSEGPPAPTPVAQTVSGNLRAAVEGLI